MLRLPLSGVISAATRSTPSKKKKCCGFTNHKGVIHYVMGDLGKLVHVDC